MIFIYETNITSIICKLTTKFILYETFIEHNLTKDFPYTPIHKYSI
jgi:hypothetical protein